MPILSKIFNRNPTADSLVRQSPPALPTRDPSLAPWPLAIPGYIAPPPDRSRTTQSLRKPKSESPLCIQVTPNVSRLLIRWGLGDALAKAGVEPQAIVFRRYATGEVVGYSRWGAAMRREHGAPYYHIHRADFHRMVYDRAVASSDRVSVRLGSTVKSVDPIPNAQGQVSVTLVSGETIAGDLIVGADGVKSLVRQVVIGRADAPEPTGDAAYRAIISTDVMLSDPDLRPFVETPEMTAWMGPGRHLMGYCIVSSQRSVPVSSNE